MSTNSELSGLFDRFAAVMNLRGDSPFKSIAFCKVSRLLKDLTVDVKKLVEDNALDTLDGVGASSQKIIAEYVRSGRSTDYEEVAATVPAGLIPMLDIPGLGPKTVRLLWKERDITSIELLKEAIDKGALEGLAGIGEKKIAQIREGIELASKSKDRLGIVYADEIAVLLVTQLRDLPEIKDAQPAGSLRRRRETVGDLDIVACLKKGKEDEAEAVIQTFTKFDGIVKVLGAGNTKASVITENGLQVDLRIVPADSYGAALMYFTGSKDHNVALRGIVQDRDMTLNEWGLYESAAFDKATKVTGKPPELKAVAGKAEADVYKALGLAYVEPELRENRGEIARAAKNDLPALITMADIKGDLHNHTTASDGKSTILQMAEAAKARGYLYLGITDHSKSQGIARGLDEKRLLAHILAVRKAQDEIKGITLLVGSEVDILVDGRLDYEDAILAQLDIVVASPHVSLRQDEKTATARMVRAIENPYVNIVGHPTGRLINSRAGLPLDFAQIYKAAAATGTALEINASYPRLDLDDIHARGALEAGCVLSINTDSHHELGFAEMVYGIGVARRAWAEAKDVINTWPLAKLKKFIAAKRPK